MRRKAEKNATSLARRFSNLAGLKLLLADELRASRNARQKAFASLEDLIEACNERPDTLVEQVKRSLHILNRNVLPIECTSTVPVAVMSAGPLPASR